MTTNPETAGVEPVTIDAICEVLRKEQDRLDGEDYIMDTNDCIDTIREKFADHPAPSDDRAAALEREQIVAWLDQQNKQRGAEGWNIGLLSLAIQRGDHKAQAMLGNLRTTVARMLAQRNFPGGTPGDIDEMTEGFLLDADAAIAAVIGALKEPSEAMLEASVFEKGCGCPCCNTSDDWEAMLDAFRTEALGEG